jgi:hypothetical protein
VALRAAAVWKKNIDPSAQRIRRPFARSSKPAASGSRSGQCGRLEQLGSDERHGSAICDGRSATILASASSCRLRQCIAHVRCTPRAAYNLKNPSEETAVC